MALFDVGPSPDPMTAGGKSFTSGGITAGMNTAFKAVAAHVGEATAQRIQLHLEYDPEPPFDAGTSATARTDLHETVQAETAGRLSARTAALERAARATKGALQ